MNRASLLLSTAAGVLAVHGAEAQIGGPVEYQQLPVCGANEALTYNGLIPMTCYSTLTPLAPIGPGEVLANPQTSSHVPVGTDLCSEYVIAWDSNTPITSASAYVAGIFVDPNTGNLLPWHELDVPYFQGRVNGSGSFTMSLTLNGGIFCAGGMNSSPTTVECAPPGIITGGTGDIGYTVTNVVGTPQPAKVYIMICHAVR